MTVMLVIAGFCLGVVLGVREARQQRGRWREYRPSINPLRDYK